MVGANDREVISMSVIFYAWEKKELGFLEMDNVGLKNRKLGKQRSRERG